MELFLAFDPREAARASAFAASLFTTPADARTATAAGSPVGFTCWVAEPEPGVFVNPHASSPRFRDPQGRALVADEHKIASAVGLLAVLTGRGEPVTVLVAAIEVAHARGTPVLGVRLDLGALAPRNLAERQIVDGDTDIARARIEAAVRGWVDQRRTDQQRPYWLGCCARCALTGTGADEQGRQRQRPARRRRSSRRETTRARLPPGAGGERGPCPRDPGAQGVRR